jgi:hypothetical protein
MNNVCIDEDVFAAVRHRLKNVAGHLEAIVRTGDAFR